METFTNYANSTLNGTITSGATTLVVASATTFPSKPYFRIAVDQEIMLVTAVSGTTFTIARGVEGTTAAAHNNGVAVAHILTSGALTSSSWATAFDLDFTSFTTATLNGGSDGTFTFSGAPTGYNYTWTKGNSANEATHANIVNGSGLNFQPASTSDYNGPTRSLPYIWLPFAQPFPSATFPNFGWNTKLRLWVAMGTDNLSTSYDDFVFGIDSNSTGFGAVHKLGYGTAGVGSPPTGGQGFYTINAGNTAGTTTNIVTDGFALSASNKTYMMEFESVAAMWTKTFRGTGLSVGAVFPNVSTLVAGTYNQFGQTPNTTGSTVVFASTGVTDPLNGMGVVLGAQRASSGTSLSVYFLRVRLDYKFQD